MNFFFLDTYLFLVSGEAFLLLLWVILPRRKAPLDYVVLATPRRNLRIYRSCSLSSNVRALFQEAVADLSNVDRFRAILGTTDPGDLAQLQNRIADASFYLLKPCRPGRIFAWSQTISPRDTTLLLGFEPFLRHLGPLLFAALGHELAHCAQEVRENLLTREWNELPVATVRRWFRVELEVHMYFWEWPLLFIGIVTFHLIVAFWSSISWV